MTETTITVLLAEDEPALPGLESLEGLARVQEARTPAQLERALLETDILVVTDFRTDLLAEVWPDDCPVRWVHATSAGVDALMIDPIKHSDIVVTNARGTFDHGIAEYVLGALLMFAKDSFGNLALQAQHRWQHRETAMLRGANALVVGAGSIGREVATLLRAMGMQVVGTARNARHDSAFHRVHRQQDLPALLCDADYVVITAPLTPDTHGLFDDTTFRQMKPGAALVNVGRGPIVRTEALLRALQQGRLAGAALDVFEEEPLPPNHPLWDQPNVMISAHMAGDFIGWRQALGQQFVDNFHRWRRGQPLDNPVNKEHGYVSNA
ncbi:MAG: hydroxyacid dehydrogenase [Alcanivorax borkumensis]|jgi:phosphoglycerate dehydrogenase-like enzyme|uniref:D-isomer specific 2-hydroxyacid dehydrogenase family n=1 Tax=Alcanivorax borkumensis (strain ATCC 700651 / DSM 11573 / NCIMB 13689 / SK2) TaxID=393595 RepID=Q0VS92_ALCBS|nr:MULTISPECIES: D-2-hydroxyacid dehydrogenase [Alcanivorax]OJH06512.1 MAG: hydroxyacid dehydrogenase [Alcanivorax borkumensis]BAP13373.1 D-isomer specific 2-hydroxyacid dehydrogenase family protein [Alcanivorax sp. NBRC 101098]CAL15956.1 D-isomer specific 2-hydroxyacid dehydrogenase family [Alcanivorax borkumensis SK2]